MKRGQPLRRKQPMNRGKGLERGEGPKRTTKLNPVSDKTKARRPEREAVRKQRCAMSHVGPCEGPIDTHEIVRRSQLKDAAYMDELTIGACRLHHGWDTYKLFAEWVGIRIRPEFYKQDPQGTIAEAARRRMDRSGVPSWWSPADLDDWRANASHYPDIDGRSMTGWRGKRTPSTGRSRSAVRPGCK